jgi:hypothetical protein
VKKMFSVTDTFNRNAFRVDGQLFRIHQEWNSEFGEWEFVVSDMFGQYGIVQAHSKDDAIRRFREFGLRFFRQN